jgi:2'-5' RNA ligase
MPHINLLYPFLPRNEFGHLLKQFEQVCENIEPFDLKFATFNYFHHRGQIYTLWLQPEPADLLLELQTSLWQIVPECDDVRRKENGFTPHLSVGQVQGRETLKTLLNNLQSRWQPIVFQLSEVCFIWRNDPPDDVFRVEKRIKLGSR